MGLAELEATTATSPKKKRWFSLRAGPVQGHLSQQRLISFNVEHTHTQGKGKRKARRAAL